MLFETNDSHGVYFYIADYWLELLAKKLKTFLARGGSNPQLPEKLHYSLGYLYKRKTAPLLHFEVSGRNHI